MHTYRETGFLLHAPFLSTTHSHYLFSSPISFALVTISITSPVLRLGSPSVWARLYESPLSLRWYRTCRYWRLLRLAYAARTHAGQLLLGRSAVKGSFSQLCMKLLQAGWFSDVNHHQRSLDRTTYCTMQPRQGSTVAHHRSSVMSHTMAPLSSRRSHSRPLHGLLSTVVVFLTNRNSGLTLE
jgi:hypothetical protein